MFSLRKISEDEATQILLQEEDHFFDVTSKDAAGNTIQKKATSFANADGGELIVGIEDRLKKGLKGGRLERWSGFVVQEEANGTIADIVNNINPQLPGIIFEFLEIQSLETQGKILKISIEKSPNVHYVSNGNVYVRKGAQCLLIKGQDITNLELSKGATSYEDQLVPDYDLERLEKSGELEEFLNLLSPKTDPSEFLKKQSLVKKSNEPIYAAVLLYDENPSAVLSRKCALKVTRYDTSETEPSRDSLKEQKTIEGPLYRQITEGVVEIQKIINNVAIMGPSGLEKAKYPPEAIKEILVNALIHRDYNISDDVSVLIFNNRIEVHSPGTLPGYISVENILSERFSRNSKVVRLLNKYPDRPNRDIGEGLNTAFQKMNEVRLKEPEIKATSTKVIVTLPHEPLASPEEQIYSYLSTHDEITNEIAREITGIKSENQVKKAFDRLRRRKLIELVPGKRGSRSAWRKVASLSPEDIKETILPQTSLF